MKKKILSFVLTLSMIVSLFEGMILPVSVADAASAGEFASAEFVFSYEATIGAIVPGNALPDLSGLTTDSIVVTDTEGNILPVSGIAFYWLYKDPNSDEGWMWVENSTAEEGVEYGIRIEVGSDGTYEFAWDDDSAVTCRDSKLVVDYASVVSSDPHYFGAIIAAAKEGEEPAGEFASAEFVFSYEETIGAIVPGNALPDLSGLTTDSIVVKDTEGNPLPVTGIRYIWGYKDPTSDEDWLWAEDLSDVAVAGVEYGLRVDVGNDGTYEFAWDDHNSVVTCSDSKLVVDTARPVSGYPSYFGAIIAAAKESGNDNQVTNINVVLGENDLPQYTVGDTLSLDGIELTVSTTPVTNGDFAALGFPGVMLTEGNYMQALHPDYLDVLVDALGHNPSYSEICEILDSAAEEAQLEGMEPAWVAIPLSFLNPNYKLREDDTLGMVIKVGLQRGSECEIAQNVTVTLNSEAVSDLVTSPAGNIFAFTHVLGAPQPGEGGGNTDPATEISNDLSLTVVGNTYTVVAGEYQLASGHSWAYQIGDPEGSNFADIYLWNPSGIANVPSGTYDASSWSKLDANNSCTYENATEFDVMLCCDVDENGRVVAYAWLPLANAEPGIEDLSDWVTFEKSNRYLTVKYTAPAEGYEIYAFVNRKNEDNLFNGDVEGYLALLNQPVAASAGAFTEYNSAVIPADWEPFLVNEYNTAHLNNMTVGDAYLIVLVNTAVTDTDPNTGNPRYAIAGLAAGYYGASKIVSLADWVTIDPETHTFTITAPEGYKYEYEIEENRFPEEYIIETRNAMVGQDSVTTVTDDAIRTGYAIYVSLPEYGTTGTTTGRLWEGQTLVVYTYETGTSSGNYYPVTGVHAAAVLTDDYIKDMKPGLTPDNGVYNITPAEGTLFYVVNGNSMSGNGISFNQSTGFPVISKERMEAADAEYDLDFLNDQYYKHTEDYYSGMPNPFNLGGTIQYAPGDFDIMVIRALEAQGYPTTSEYMADYKEGRLTPLYFLEMKNDPYVKEGYDSWDGDSNYYPLTGVFADYMDETLENTRDKIQPLNERLVQNPNDIFDVTFYPEIGKTYLVVTSTLRQNMTSAQLAMSSPVGMTVLDEINANQIAFSMTMGRVYSLPYKYAVMPAATSSYATYQLIVGDAENSVNGVAIEVEGNRQIMAYEIDTDGKYTVEENIAISDSYYISAGDYYPVVAYDAVVAFKPVITISSYSPSIEVEQGNIEEYDYLSVYARMAGITYQWFLCDESGNVIKEVPEENTYTYSDSYYSESYSKLYLGLELADSPAGTYYYICKLTAEGAEPVTSEVMTVTVVGEESGEHEHEYTYTSNNDGTHNGTCTCGEDAIENEPCTYVDGKCEKCGFDEPVTPPEHEHEYTYTSNNDGTHNGACDCGEDAIENEPCTYVDGKCEKCGYDEPVTPPAHEHEYEYTSNEDGTHNGACECGEDAIENEPCTYVDGKCSKCGAAEPVTPPAHEHSYTYTSNNDGTHNGVCECGEDAITNETCTYVEGKCEKCGYAEPGTDKPEDPTKHSVTVTVKEETSDNAYVDCDNAIVTLISLDGDEIVQNASSGNGVYVFENVADGIYNLVIQRGDKIKTVLVEIAGKNVDLGVVYLPVMEINSKVDVTVDVDDDSPIEGALVGGLDKLAEDIADEIVMEDGVSVSVEVSMQINAQMSDDVDPEHKGSIEEEARTQSENLTFLDITIDKTITTKKTGEDEVKTTDPIHDTVSLLEILIPFTTDGRYDFAVYRYHENHSDGNVQKLTTNKNSDGEYITVEGGVIKMYVRYFSTYAIGYSDGTKPTEYTVSFDANGGTGTMIDVTAPENAEYPLPACGFTAPEGKEFKAWEIDGTEYAVGHKITVTKNITVKAVWKDIPAPPVIPDIPTPPVNPSYRVNVEDAQGGTILVTPKTAAAGTTVTVTVTPDAGYELVELIITNAAGDAVKWTPAGNDRYTFVMPDGKVTVSAVFAKIKENCPKDSTCPIWPFKDAETTAWYHDGVHYCIENDLMNGLPGNLFDPNGTTTRAQIVTILWRLEGEPYANYAMSFTDVAAGQWYTEAVRWAAVNGIVEGYSDTVFAPNDAITREQFAAILWRFCQYKGIDVSVGENTNILSYSDAFDIHSWAIPAMQWACGAGVINGIADGNSMKLDPTGSATRAQVATMLWRFCVEIMEP